MGDMVRLQNTTKRPRRALVFNLDKSAAPVRIDRRRFEESRQGDRRIRMETVVVPDSLRVPVSGLSAPIPRELTESCRELADALKKKDIRIVAYRPPLEERRAAALAARQAEEAKSGRTAVAKPPIDNAADSADDEEKTTKGTSRKSSSKSSRRS